MTELPTWAWAYGQTPEFTYSPTQTFSFGTVSAEITSKHGLITTCKLTLESAPNADAPHTRIQSALNGLSQALVGQKYAFFERPAVEDTRADAAAEGQTVVHDAVLGWLESEMRN
jgi:lipoate---protein ligase